MTTYHHPGPLSRNLGVLTSWNPLGLSRPVMGLLYLFCLFLGVGQQNTDSCEYATELSGEKSGEVTVQFTLCVTHRTKELRFTPLWLIRRHKKSFSRHCVRLVQLCAESGRKTLPVICSQVHNLALHTKHVHKTDAFVTFSTCHDSFIFCCFIHVGLMKLNVITCRYWCCATNRKDAGSIPDGVIGIFH